MTRTSAFIAGNVRDELSHLLSGPPTTGPGGNDAGWFCREHALIVAAISRMLGENPELCLGMLALRVPDVFLLDMRETDEDHSWCRVEGIAPIDASANTAHFGEDVPSLGFVCPDIPGSLGVYSLAYLVQASREDMAKETQRAGPTIVYSEVRVHRDDVRRLLDRPFSFLLPPPPGTPNFLQAHGPHVLFRVAAHLYRFGRGEAQSVRDLPQDDAIREVCRRHVDGRAFVLGFFQ